MSDLNRPQPGNMPLLAMLGQGTVIYAIVLEIGLSLTLFLRRKVATSVEVFYCRCGRSDRCDLQNEAAQEVSEIQGKPSGSDNYAGHHDYLHDRVLGVSFWLANGGTAGARVPARLNVSHGFALHHPRLALADARCGAGCGLVGRSQQAPEICGRNVS
jgi:hypothetical protein